MRLPPNVVACVPGDKTPVHFSFTRMPPIGRPPAIPLANVTTSGIMPYCWNAKSVPVRPIPVCTSVGQQKQVIFLAESRNRFHVILIERQNATLALDELQHNGARAVGCFFQAVDVISLGIYEASVNGKK